MIRALQSIGVGITMSLIEMMSHKLRSALSVIGVMLGVASLVAMLTLIAGIDVFINRKMVKWAGSVWFVNRRDAQLREKITWSRSPSLRFSDGPYLEHNARDVRYFYRTIERRSDIVISGRNENAGIRGMDRQSMDEDLEEMRITEGIMLSDNDFASGAASCIISWELAQRIRAQMRLARVTDETLVGRKCTIGNFMLDITGIFGPIDPDNKPWHLRRSVLMPIVTMQRLMTGFDPDPGSVRILVNDPKTIKKQLRGITPVLRSRHRGVEDFEIRTADWIDEVRSMLNNAALLMGIVSVISLLVGGLSIMNVMLSSISERIHEIGVRKALGARRLQIFVQFTVETITLSCMGGVFGMVLGMAPLLFREAIYKATDGAIEPTLFVSHLFGVFGIIVFVGICFGLYPALKASRMNPVEALRYE
ncbi:MAG: ABC transporter permease [Chitinispirillaceae bacterium]|nr:ABC transporter permease [Chitinispirillaceae bacterium]